MKEFEEKIKKEGKIFNDEILKVDGFINHQVDASLMEKLGEAIAEHFKGQGITKVACIESSGIAPGLMTAKALQVPMVIMKKQPSNILNDNLYETEVTSFTKEISYNLCVSKEYISDADHILIVDDFLANGEAATGAVRLIRSSHATIAGIAVLIEKSFQPGHDKLVSQGLDVFALAKIAGLKDGEIIFAE
jgi:xanthine phosphoribosyltransferase